MARKVRIQYPGAVYHIMSRGDHYEPIFMSDDDRNMYLDTLEEVCEKTGWIIHSYVLMKNHYHWLLETPEPNLVDGMRWFQSTYTQRFNSRNKLVGHLFQGRYRSLIIDPQEYEYFVFVSNYIHLNPAKAGLLDKNNPDLNQYKWSSYPYYLKPPGKRPSWLHVDKIFTELKIKNDNAAGRKKYAAYMHLALLEVLDPGKIVEYEKEWNAIRNKWYLGGDTFKEKMLKHVSKLLEGKKDSSYYGDLKREHSENTVELLLKQALAILGFQETDLMKTKKNDQRKQLIAWLLKVNTTLSNQWIADRLCMGHWTTVAKSAKIIRNSKNRNINRIKKTFQNIL